MVANSGSVTAGAKYPIFARTPTSPQIFSGLICSPVMTMLSVTRGRQCTQRANQFARHAVSSQQWRECNLIGKENVFSSVLSESDQPDHVAGERG